MTRLKFYRPLTHFLWMFVIAMSASQLLPATAAAQDKEKKKADEQIWYGELDAGARLFRFIVTSSSADEKNQKAELLSIDEGGAKFVLDEVAIDDKQFRFVLKASGATYSAKMNEDGKKALGKWSQGGAALDLVFEKRDSVPVDKPNEIWFGTLNAGFQKLDLQFRIYNGNKGAKSVYVDSLSQSLGGFKAKIARDGNKVTIESPSLRAKFTGDLNEAGTEIDGKWTQGLPLALKLVRKDKVVEPSRPKLNRPQTPKEPFPYDIEDVTFTNEADKTKLAGTVTRPKGDGPFPIAVLISGSGPQDRDETILDHKPFWVIADHLARNGVAVLRFDDRGVGKSSGKFEKATTEDFARDVSSAIAFAKTIAKIDAKKIGLIGHSEGGLVATKLAATDKDVAWVILMASPGVSGEEILYSQGQLIIAAEGGNEMAKKRQRLMQEKIFAKAKQLSLDEDIEPHVAGIVDDIMKTAKQEDDAENKKDDEKTDKPDDSRDAKEKEIRSVLTELVRANLKAMHDPWFRYFAAYDPIEDLKQIKCPVLVMNGEKDVQVDPKLNLPKIEASLKEAGNTRYAIREMPGLNHMFQTCKTGGISEYQSIEETIAPAALEAISGWLKTLDDEAK